MTRSLLHKCVTESRLLFAACATALFAFCWVRVWIVGQFEMSRFQAVIEQFREFERFSPVPFDQLFTYAGRIALTYDEPIVILCMSVWAISRGSDCVSGELGRGTMEMLLAQPVSRLRVLLTHASVTVVGAALLAGIVWLGVNLGIQTTTVTEEVPATLTFLWIDVPNPLGEPELVQVPMRSKVDPNVYLPAAFNLFSLCFCLAGISTLMSSWDRYRWRTIGIVIGIYVVQLLVKILAMSTESFSWMYGLSFFTAYEPEAFVSVAVRTPEEAWSVLRSGADGVAQLGPLGYSSILLTIGLFSYTAAALIFCRRDLPAPL